MKKVGSYLAATICMVAVLLGALTLKAEAANITSGTLGDNGGISWTYNADTKTLTVTGADSGLNGKQEDNYESQFAAICSDVEVIIMKNCTIKGSAKYLFADLESLKRIEFDNFDTSNITDMGGMFSRCRNLVELDLSKFNTSKVIGMHGMFSRCNSLVNLNLKSFDTSNVKSMGAMFYECSSLVTLDLSNFNTANVNSMYSMFAGCSSLVSVDLSSFNTSNVDAMYSMFEDCKSLVSLDLRHFDTSKLVTLYGMFHRCVSLESLDISRFDTSKVNDISYLFSGCNNLTSLDLSSFDLSQVRRAIGPFNAYDNNTMLLVIHTPRNMPADLSLQLPTSYKDINSRDEYSDTMYLTSEYCNTTLIKRYYRLENVELSEYSLNIPVGGADQLSVTVFPLGAPIEKIEWMTSDRSIATVDEKGKIRALRTGTVTITVRVTDITGESMDACCEVQVVRPVMQILMSENTLDLMTGETHALRAVVDPDTATIKELAWTISDKSVATVDEYGIVKAVGPGTAIITATATDGSGVSANCEVTVTQPVKGVTLDPSVLNMNIGESKTLTVNISPVNASNQEVTWSVSNSGAQVVTVRGNGEVTAVGVGTATITVRTKDGNFSASCEVTVKDPVAEQERQVRAFVERMYTIVLGRAAEAQGLNDWTARLMAKEIDGATLVDMFVNSDEFVNRNTSDEEYIKILYRAVLGREADEGGLKMWKNMLADGWTRDYILEGLVLSTEFKNICDSYGIIAAFNPTAESQVRSFVKRMYTVVLSRRADAVGLEEWTQRLLNGTANGAQLADGFISSDEFVNRNLSDEKYVKVLYRAFFNREPDEGGFNVWMNELAKGVSRRDVMKGFVHSVEFSDLCAQYGIIRGEMQ